MRCHFNRLPPTKATTDWMTTRYINCRYTNSWKGNDQSVRLRSPSSFRAYAATTIWRARKPTQATTDVVVSPANTAL